MFEQRSAYENLTRVNFIGAGQYDIPTIWNDEVKPEKFIGFNYAKQRNNGRYKSKIVFNREVIKWTKHTKKPKDYYKT